MGKATAGSNGQFTYDFGIAIAQGTLTKLKRLTATTLSLASAYYALKSTAKEYVATLKENTLRFGGLVSTLNAMNQAQDRLIKGQTLFSVDDQLTAMNNLAKAGINVKDNFEFISKAAHATGKSVAEFSNAVSQGIAGNMGALVEMGMLTERATRMFDKYQANTVMRQQAILNFVKEHKGLQAAIKNDFETIQDQILRIKETWKAFLRSIIGNPKDPTSLYGAVTSTFKKIAEAFARNAEQIKAIGSSIGAVLGWIVKQVGHFVIWTGKQMKSAVGVAWKSVNDFAEQTRSLLVWLEFWKVHIVKFFRTYASEIKFVVKWLLILKMTGKAVSWITTLTSGIRGLSKAFGATLLLQKRYIKSMGIAGTKLSRWLMSLAVFMPRWMRRIWITLGKGFGVFFEATLRRGFKGFMFEFKNLVKNIWYPIRGVFSRIMFGLKHIIREIPKIFRLVINFAKANPVAFAIITVIQLLVVLYAKCEGFRNFVNAIVRALWSKIKDIFSIIISSIRTVWHACRWLFWTVFKWTRDKVITPIKNFFKAVGGWISDMWGKFMDTRVGGFINDYLIKPIKSLFEWLEKIWQKIVGWIKSLPEWFKGKADDAKVAAGYANGGYVPSKQYFVAGENGREWVANNKLVNNPQTAPIIAALEKYQRGGQLNVPNTNNSMVLNSGAVQIVVTGNTDPGEIAREVKRVLEDMQRAQGMRGGF